jgi:hypothetical protein
MLAKNESLDDILKNVVHGESFEKVVGDGGG